MLLPIVTRKIIGIVGNNVKQFSALWAIMKKNVWRCGTTQSKITFFSLSLPLKEQFTLSNVYLGGVQLPVII
jgi:hypothetical protein